MGAEDRDHVEKLRREYTRRLRQLELRAARQGDSVDPAVPNEIEEIKMNLAALKTAEQPQLSTEVMNVLAQRDQWNGMLSAVTRLGVEVNNLAKGQEEDRATAKEWRTELRTEMHEVRQVVEAERQAREPRQSFVDETFKSINETFKSIWRAINLLRRSTAILALAFVCLVIAIIALAARQGWL